MDTCANCGKPIDFGVKNERRSWKIDKSRTEPEKKTVSVRCPYCGTWNSKEVEE